MQNKLYAERKADNANRKEANVAHHSAIAAKAEYDSICEQLYNDRKHTLIVQPECLVDPGPVDDELEAEMARIEEAMERSKGRELSTSVGSSSGTASTSVIVLPRSSQYHVEAIYGICDGDHDEPPSGSTGTAGSSPSSKSSAGTGSTSTAVTTVEWSEDDDEDGDDEEEMVDRLGFGPLPPPSGVRDPGTSRPGSSSGLSKVRASGSGGSGAVPVRPSPRP